LARIAVELSLGEWRALRIQCAPGDPLLHEHGREKLLRALLRVRRGDEVGLEQRIALAVVVALSHRVGQTAKRCEHRGSRIGEHETVEGSEVRAPDHRIERRSTIQAPTEREWWAVVLVRA